MLKDVPLYESAKRGAKVISELKKLFPEFFFVFGADPQTGSGNGEVYGGICSGQGALQDGVKKSEKMSKTAEILRVEEKHLAPPSGQTNYVICDVMQCVKFTK